MTLFVNHTHAEQTKTSLRDIITHTSKLNFAWQEELAFSKGVLFDK